MLNLSTEDNKTIFCLSDFMLQGIDEATFSW